MHVAQGLEKLEKGVGPAAAMRQQVTTCMNSDRACLKPQTQKA